MLNFDAFWQHTNHSYDRTHSIHDVPHVRSSLLLQRVYVSDTYICRYVLCKSIVEPSYWYNGNELVHSYYAIGLVVLDVPGCTSQEVSFPVGFNSLAKT